MATKEEVLESIVKPSYGKSEVKALITSITTSNKGKIVPPKRVIKGDVFTMILGVKSRPLVVYKVKEGMAYALPFTTTNNEMALVTTRVSRFFDEDVEESYFSKGVIVVTESFVRDNFCFNYEYKRDIDNAVKLIKKLI